jgi:hypothetical protein
MKRKQLLGVGLIALILIFIMIFFSALIGARIPSEDMTKTRQMILEVRIRDYYEQKGVMPSALQDLTRIEGKDNSIIDGWGKEMLYLTNRKFVLLRSYGRDGKIGGEGKDADMEIKFTLP